MLRITTIEDETPGVVLRVEGLLSGAGAATLVRSVRSCRVPPGLDLSGVSFADADGIRAVEGLLSEGLRLVRSSAFVEALLGTGRPGSIAGASPDQGLEARVRANAARMLATAARILGSEDRAAEVVQEAVARIANEPASPGEASSFSARLQRFTIDAAIRKLRGPRAAEPAIEPLLPRFDEDGRRVDGTTSWTASPVELLQRRETRQALHRCIRRLPQEYRLVLLLRDVEGLGAEETALALDIPLDAVKERLHRARLALRTLLERELLEAAPTIAA